MNQKGFANIILILIIIVVALVGARAYFILTRQVTLPTPSPISSPTPTPKPSPTPSPTPMPTPAPVPPDSTVTSGFLEGLVTFRFNNPCSGTTMPCDPLVIITIYKADGKTVAGTTHNWQSGLYSIELHSGEYVLYTQSDPSKSDIKVNQVIIVSGKTTKLDLIDPIAK